MLRIRKTTSLAALAAAMAIPLALPVTALAAADLSYTYLEIDYINLDIDDFNDNDGLIEDFDDGSGWGVNGSVAFTPMFFAFAAYSETDSDVNFTSDGTTFFSSSQDVARLDVGLGLNKPLDISALNQPDLVVRAAYVDIDVGNLDLGGSSDPDIDDLNDDGSDGWYSDASLRSQLLPQLEASVGVRYTDIEDASEFSFIGNALFEINPNWGVNLAVDAGDDLRTYALGLRYSFARF
jgi:hypothetical protein